MGGLMEGALLAADRVARDILGKRHVESRRLLNHL